jgi:tetratricopeptide (TPR) repeat protein
VNIDQFATRDLSAAEARKLAQQALDDPDLFDALVARGAAEASLNAPAVQAAISRPTRRVPWVIAVCAAAAAVILALFLWRSSSRTMPQPAEQARAIVSTPAILPSLDAASNGPVLLAAELGPSRSQNRNAFRGDGASNREPQSTGIVTAVDDGEATVNLGSLDGLIKGAELGPISITTIFRDHARGKITPGQTIHVNDRLDLPPAVHLSAVLHEVDALAASGDLDQARALGRKALAAGSSGETRMLLERLAALDYQAGAMDAAREHYEAAANNFFETPAASPVEQATTLNSLGALYLLRGDTASAVKPLNQAAALTAIPADLRAQVLNNLGVLDEMRGDLPKARDDYNRASSEPTSARERSIAQANLTRTANLKRP